MAESYKPVRLVMIDNYTSYKKLYHLKNGFLSTCDPCIRKQIVDGYITGKQIWSKALVESRPLGS